MNGNSKIGLDGNGANRDYRSRGMDMPRATVSSNGSGMRVISRSMDCETAGARRRGHARTLSIVAVCVVAGIIISALALVSVGYQNAAHVQAPGIPHTVRGYVYDVGGVTKVAGANVNITNLRTMSYSNTTVTAGNGYYNFDLNTLLGSWYDGDPIRMVAWSSSLSLGGENVTYLTGLGSGEWLNATLGTVIQIPEFPMALLPISGMLVLFAVVSLKRRSEDP